jgi:hypothetical protein
VSSWQQKQNMCQTLYWRSCMALIVRLRSSSTNEWLYILPRIHSESEAWRQFSNWKQTRGGFYSRKYLAAINPGNSSPGEAECNSIYINQGGSDIPTRAYLRAAIMCRYGRWTDLDERPDEPHCESLLAG